MSKAVTHEEVEDVLSSIRRLVSEDKRPLAGLRNTVPEVVVAEAEPKVSDRFVLTPALRVLEDEQVNEAPDEDGPFVLEAVVRDTVLPEAADEKPMMLFPSKEQKSSSAEDVDALVHDALQAEAPSAATDDLDEGDYSDEDYWDVDEDPDTDASETVARQTDADTDGFDWNMGAYRIKKAPVEAVKVEAAEVASVEDTPVEAEEVDKFFAGNDVIETLEHASLQAENMLDEEAEAAFIDLQESVEPPPVHEASHTIPLTAKIAALEAAVTDIANDWEPDGDEIDTLASSATPAMAWEDDVMLDAKGVPVHEQAEASVNHEDETSADVEVDASAAATAAAAFAGDDQVIDEAALREMVSEIVRAELQGALGERITRNVRKLVRREIHRALTAQDLE